MAKSKTSQSVKDPGFKKIISRSAAYPAFGISYAREFTQSIYSNFGLNSFVSRETIAKILKKNAEYLKQPISTCVQYGLLELRSAVGYKPSQRFMDMYKQDDPVILRTALVACIKEPKLYSNLLEQYKGDIVPPLPVLANTLFKKHNIVESTAEKAAAIFLQNLEELGLISVDRKLVDIDNLFTNTTKDDLEKEAAVIECDELGEVNGNLLADPINPKVDNSLFIIEVPLGNNRKAKISCPMDYTVKDLNKVIKVISSYLDED